MKYIEGLVSVIMPTYHSVQYLDRAVNSVLNQTYSKIELLLINDNTPNDDYSIALYEQIEKYKNNEKFIFLEQPEHINGAAARNYGIRRAKGEYIAFLDDDDWWREDKIEKQIEFIKRQDNSCGGVSTLVESYEWDKPVRWMRPYQDGLIFKQILRREIDVSTGSFLAKHEALDIAGYFDERLKRHQEIQLLSFFSSKYEIKLLPEYLTCYNLTSNNNMPDSNKLRIYKEAFFESVSPILIEMKKSEVRRIKALHMFELAYLEYRERKYSMFLKDCLPIFANPKTLFIAIKRVWQRKQEYKKPRNN